MKKVIALIVTAVLFISLFSGCGPAEVPAESTGETTAPTPEAAFLVGYSSVDITPKESVPLAGSGGAGIGSHERMSKEVIDPLYATCIAFSDETGNIILLFNLDILYAHDASETLALTYCASDIAKATGVPMKQVMFSSTHNHNAPDLRIDMPCIENYNKSLRTWLTDAAKEAIADLKPAKMYTAEARPQGQNFVRHYYMSDGSVAGANFGDFKNNTIVSHVRDADNQMQLVKFTREGGKDVVLANWQAHPYTGDAKYGILSNTYHMRQKVEAELNCHFQYLLGASGNVVSSSRIKEEQDGATYVQRYQKLAQYAIDAAANFKEVPTGKVQILGKEYSGPNAAGNGNTTMSLYAFSVGDVAFITAPYEMFCENGEQIKAASPFSTTMIVTCANGNRSYMPSQECYDYGGLYEIGGCKFQEGTAEVLVGEYTAMLKALFETR